MNETEQLKNENEKLKIELAQIKSNPFFEGYMAQKKQIDSWHRDLSENPTTLIYNEEKGDSDQKAFEKALKFMLESGRLYDNLELLKSKLTEAEVEKTKQAGTALEKVLQSRGVFKV